MTPRKGKEFRTSADGRFGGHAAARRRDRRACGGAFRGGAGRRTCRRASSIPTPSCRRACGSSAPTRATWRPSRDWLKECGITTVAMESTGVYWIPLFELLASRGFEVILVDPRQTQAWPGRPKSDVLDCQWIRRLHSYGLLTASFRPADEIVRWRGYQRQREMLIRYAAQHVQHLQKALEEMNVKLTEVVRTSSARRG